MSRYWHWGTKIALVYILFVCGTITMVAIAVTQRTDLVAPDYYQRALRQDDRMAAEQNAAALGASLVVDSSAPDRLIVHWPHTPEAGTITLYRASNAAADRNVPVATSPTDGGAEQTVALSDMERGTWKAQITWTAAGRPYYVEREFTIK